MQTRQNQVFNPEIAEDYAFELVVSDGRVKSTPAIVNVNIEEANEIPVAILPSKISVELGESITLDGSASCDADNDALLYNFSQVSGPAEILRSTVSQESKFSVIPKAIGTYSFELIVNDGRANSDPALMCCGSQQTKLSSCSQSSCTTKKQLLKLDTGSTIRIP